jgi:chemotaxis protein histidine kinase CheA
MPARIAPLFALFAIALPISFASADAARAVNPAADALADKFSGAEEARLKKEAEEKARRDAEVAAKAESERLKAQEIEMLARARAEAAEREAALRKEAEAKHAEDERLAAESKAAEREAALRKEAEAKRAEDERLAAEAKAAEERRLAEEAQKAKDAEATRTALSAEREREARELSEKLKRVREERPAAAPGVDTAEPKKAEPSPKTADREPEVRTVTVLLVMEPGTYGIRRGNKSADPVLCVDTGCYVSMGPGSAAKWMAKGLALGPMNTLGLRAGACRNKPTCIFRNVDLGASRRLQPVDLHYLKHDRREAITARADQSCAGADGQLSCSDVVSGKGWRAWIVPESVALKTGAPALEKAAASLAKGSISASLR